MITAPEHSLTAPIPARSGARVVTPDWLLTLPQFSFDAPRIRWMNNSQLLYSSPPSDNKKNWTIELIDANTGTHELLAEGSNPKPSPDGQWIAFGRGDKQEKQLWIMDSKGKNLKQLSHIENGLSDDYFSEYSWAPHSSQIALTHKPFIEHWEKRPQPKSTVNIIDITSGKMKQIASFEEALHYLSWFPNGEEILFVRERVGLEHKEEGDREWVQALNINTGHLRTLAEFDGLQQSLMPALSPNGKQVALMYDADNPMFNFMPSLGLVSNNPVNSDVLPSIKRLTHEIKLFSPQWSPDNQRIYVKRDYGAYTQIYEVDSKTGEASQITNAPLDIESYAISPDGSQLAWMGQDAHGTRILRVAASGGHNVRDLKAIPGAPDDMALSEVREISWQAPDYPARLNGLLFMPLNYQEGKRYPLVVDIHGGGGGAGIYLQGGILVNTPLEWQMWTAKGYAVFVPEFRSSASFGSLAITRDDLQNYDAINCDIKDIEAGIDELISQGIVDHSRLAVIGHSAGGRRANWLLATTHRFLSVVSKEGWADEWIYFLNEPPLKRVYAMYGGAPWEVPQNYLKNSAVFHSNGATTPTLFLMGNPEMGGADPHNTVKMLYNSIKAQGVETEYVKYSDEGHVFEKPSNRQDALERSIKWIDDHFKYGKKYPDRAPPMRSSFVSIVPK